MKTYVLKSWLTGEVVYKSDKTFPSELEMWQDVSLQKHYHFGTYAVIVKE